MMIYTYGGGHVLYKIFNGIAALCADDSQYFTAFLTPALLIGVVWGGALGLAQANIGLFGRKWFIPYLVLSLLLVPKTTVWIKDEVDPTFGSDKVDNIPTGLALVAGATSTLGRGLTELIEASFPTGDITKFTKTGYAFPGRLAQEARTMRISDPTILENVKDWTHQCVWLPYLKTNIKGKRDSARYADDLVTWVEANGHPSLGVYWRNEDGVTGYKTCRQAAPLVRKALQAEEQQTLMTLAGKLFGFSDKENTGEQLKPYMQEAWQMVGKSTKDASHHIQQILVVNALKEGFDDGRERFGYRRLHPELVSINAARSMEAQGMTGLIKGVAASVSMPLLQAFLFGLLSILFLLVIPFCFMPGGITIFGLWVKMVFAVQLWPVFSTVLNALSMIWMDRASESVLMGGEGFTVATTSGLADAAFNVASWSAGMQMLVPVLAWAFVSKSGYAMTSVFQSATGSIESTASRLGNDTVDGNVSMNNISMLNSTLAGEAVAQQSWGANMNFASTLNTGDRSITNTLGGDVRVQENLSSLATTYNTSEAIQGQFSQRLAESQALTDQHTKAVTQLLQGGTSDLLSFTNKIGDRSVSYTDGVSNTEQASYQKLADESKGLTEAISKKHGLSAHTVAEAAAGWSLSNALGGIGKAFGFNLSADQKVSAQNQEALDSIVNSDEGKKLVENYGKMIQFAKQQGSQVQDSAGKSAAENFQHSFSSLESRNEARTRSVTQTQSLEKAMSMAKSYTFTESSKEDDAVIAYVAQEKGIDKVAATTFLNEKSPEARDMVAGYIAQKTQEIMSHVEGVDHTITPSQSKSFLDETDSIRIAKIDENLINKEGRDVVQAQIRDSRFLSESALQNKYADDDRLRAGFSAQNEGKMEEIDAETRNAHGGLQQEHHSLSKEPTMWMAGKKAVKETLDSGSSVLNFFRGEDQVKPTTEDPKLSTVSISSNNRTPNTDFLEKSDVSQNTSEHVTHGKISTERLPERSVQKPKQDSRSESQDKLVDMNKKLRK